MLEVASTFCVQNGHLLCTRLEGALHVFQGFCDLIFESLTNLDEGFVLGGTHAVDPLAERAQRVTLEPRETRRLILMRFYGGTDDQSAAQSFGITATTVRTRIHRALARLRDHLANLGAWFPPLFGKLGAQLCSIGLAPAFIGAFIVVGATTANPKPTLVTVVLVAAAHPTPSPSIQSAKAAVVTDGQTRARVRVTGSKRASPPAQPLAVPPPVVEFTDDTAVAGTVLQPNGIDVVAEPPRPVLPYLVEAPTTFFVQIEKMVE